MQCVLVTPPITSNLSDAPHMFSMHLGPVSPEDVPDDDRPSVKDRDFFCELTPCTHLCFRRVKRSAAYCLLMWRMCLLPPLETLRLVKGRVDPHIPPIHAEEWARTVMRAWILSVTFSSDFRYAYYLAAKELEWFKEDNMLVEFFTHADHDPLNKQGSRQSVCYRTLLDLEIMIPLHMFLLQEAEDQLPCTPG